MRKSLFFVLISSLILTSGALAEGKPFKNVIIFVGDGMGFSHIEAGSLYRFGEPQGQVYRQWLSLAMSTYSLNNKDGYEPEKAWEDFRYFKRIPTDSAAAATAISTGEKTKNGMLGLTPEGAELRHLIEDAEALGKATGVLSTVRVDHATPAGFAVHVTARGSREEIGGKLVNSALEVVMGPGHPWFDADGKQVGGLDPDPYATPKSYDAVGGLENWKALEAGAIGADADGDGTPDPWTLVQSSADIRALAQGETPKRVFGLAPVEPTLQQERSGDLKAEAFAVPPTPDLPDMSALVAAAINVLDEDADGFFLMAEGGAIDWASHDNAPGRMIEEQIDFDKAVETAAAWVEANSSWDETAIFVTADHECGYLCGPGSDPEWQPLTSAGKETQPGMAFMSTSHTNQLVPLFGKGAGTEALREHIRGEDKRRGPFVDNTDISKVIRAAWKKQ
jgi:alkaline phosphatase